MENAVKSQVLGMPFGTANNQLRKKLLFHLAGKLEMLECFRCHRAIESIDHFSIEHTESWMFSDDPIKTFFDVEKIAFSHLDCNVGASGERRKIISPEGQSWCFSCKQHLLEENFSSGVEQRWNGFAFQCKKCAVIRHNEYRKRTGRR